MKGEGDAFWTTFPSVAAAARAAVAMREELQARFVVSPDTALRARFAITLGDVLHQDADIFGPAVNLAARIEAITPPESIYIDDTSWAALGDREFEASVADSFVPKGFDRTVTVYRIEPRGRVRRFMNEVVMFTDMVNFTQFVAEHEDNVELLQALLTEWDSVHQMVAGFGGRVRVNLGDSVMVMLPTVERAVEFFVKLHSCWGRFTQADERLAPLTVRASVNVGDYLFCGTTVIGRTINDCARAMAIRLEDQDGILVLTAAAVSRLEGTSVAARFERLPIAGLRYNTLGDHVFIFDAKQSQVHED